MRQEIQPSYFFPSISPQPHEPKLSSYNSLSFFVEIWLSFVKNNQPTNFSSDYCGVKALISLPEPTFSVQALTIISFYQS
jgi:hypothetical protein